MLVVKLAASPLGADAYVVAVGLAAGLAWTWLPRRGAARWAARQVPIAYGLVVLLFAALAARLLAGMEHTDRELAGWIGGPFAAAGLSLGLLALEAAIFRELSLPPTHPAAVTAWLGTALLCAITFRTPGIAAALGVLALGFHRRRPLLVGLSIVFLIAFSGFFYYSLSATLLTKSAVLVGSGLVLLGVRFVLGHSTREAVEERP